MNPTAPITQFISTNNRISVIYNANVPVVDVNPNPTVPSNRVKYVDQDNIWRTNNRELEVYRIRGIGIINVYFESTEFIRADVNPTSSRYQVFIDNRRNILYIIIQSCR